MRPETNPIDAARTVLVRDIMTPEPVTIDPDTGIEQVIELFLGRGFGHVPVVDDTGRPIGMLSKTDVVRDAHLRGDTQVEQTPGTKARGIKYIPEGAHVHEVGDRARDLMTPIALWVPETASVAEAARVLATGQVHAVVVTGSEGRVVGIVSALDVAAWVAGVAPSRAPVASG
jgi:CBS domain-containing protein